jgi:Flp pilus assembly protein TadB
MPPAGWLWAAAALLLWPVPDRRAGPPGSARRRARGQPRRVPAGALPVIAAAGVVAAAVGLLGLQRGVVAAVIGCPAAVLVIRRLPNTVRRRGISADLPLALDLTAAALRAGQLPEAALSLAAPAAGEALAAELMRVAGLLRLGADPDEAWRVLAGHAELESVAAVARRSSSSGIRLAGAFEEAAAELRLRIRTAGGERAARTGVLAMAPVGLCFLPAFVCLGIVPAVVGIASGVLRTLP